jgi:hypothetical protein
MILVVPRLPIIIFATNKRTATSIVQMQNQWLSMLPMGPQRKCRALSYIKVVPEEAVLRGECRTDAERQVHPDASGIWPMPASKNGTRGVTAKIVIMEEAAYIDPMIWEMICMPLLGVTGTVLLGISTPSSQDNFYAGLISRKRKDTGEDLFFLVLIGMACEDCRARGIASHCAHMRHMLPAWKDSEGQKLLFDVLSESAYRQEAQGEQMKDRVPCFKPHEVDALWKRKRKRIIGEHGVVFIAVDPSGGSGAVAGGGSEVAMTAFVYDEHDNAVVRTFSSTLTHSHTSQLIPQESGRHKVHHRKIFRSRNFFATRGTGVLLFVTAAASSSFSFTGLVSRIRHTHSLGLSHRIHVKQAMELDVQNLNESFPHCRRRGLLQVPDSVLKVGNEPQSEKYAEPLSGLVRVFFIVLGQLFTGVACQCRPLCQLSLRSLRPDI